MGDKLMSYILFIFVLLFPVFTAYAAPTPTGVSGTVQHGQQITISGTLFGTKTTAAPELWDTVDNISAYSAVADGATIPTGGANPWADNSPFDPGKVKMETTDSMRHAHSSKMYKGLAASLGASLDGRRIANETGSVYLSWWMKPSGSFPGSSTSAKILRLADSVDNETRTLTWDIDNSYIYIPPNSGGCYDGDWYSLPGLSANTWHHFAIYFNSSSKVYTAYINDSQVMTYNWASAGCSAVSFDEVWRLGWDGTPSFTFWMDDIYVDNTASRVEICTNSTWTARGACEVQIPSAWSASSITATVNQGAFANGATAYLYVVDSTGAVNTSGLPVAFGTTQADTTPPVISGGSPSGTLAAGTTQVTVSFATNEAATCRWSGVQNTPYASMSNTFPTTGGTTHSGVSAGLSDGNAYALYVKCIDVAGNVTAGDYPIAWAIASGATASGKISASGKFQFH